MNAIQKKHHFARVNRAIQARSARTPVPPRDSGHTFFACDLVVDADEREGRIGALGWFGIALASAVVVESVVRIAVAFARGVL